MKIFNETEHKKEMLTLIIISMTSLILIHKAKILHITRDISNK